MRQNVIEAVKTEIKKLLKDHLHEEGIAYSDTPVSVEPPQVVFEGMEDLPLEGSLLQWEIRLMLGILGKPWQCDALANGIYTALHPHQLTLGELTVVLMSLQVESVRARNAPRRATIRYIVGES